MKSNQIMNPEKFFYIFVAGIFLIIVSPALLADGMFVDGLIYATISKNLSAGLGSFWHLHFTDSIFPVFSTHPPLSFGLESIFFKILGSSRFTEHSYSLLLAVLTAIAIVYIWKSASQRKHGGWLPLLFWVAMPSVTWAASNNMLENTLDFFICMSVLFFILSLDRHRVVFLALSGVMLSCGFMTKGLITLFPLSLPFFFWLFVRKRKFITAVIDTIVIIISAAIPILLIFTFVTDAREMLTRYIRIVFDLTTTGATKDSRLYILSFLFRELLPVIIIVILILSYAGWKKYDFSLLKRNIRVSLAFLFLGLSGVLPIMITRMQSGYYLVPSLAFFAISQGLLVYPVVERVITEITSSGSRIFRTISIAFLGIGLSLCLYFSGSICRDRDIINDLKKISSVIPDNSTIGILPEMNTSWNLHGYYGRYHNITLDADLSHNNEFLLVHNPLSSDTLMKHFIKMELGTAEYSIYRQLKKSIR